MRARPFLLIALAALSLAAPSSAAPVLRRVLALHKGSEGDTNAGNLTLSLLEQPLESLGLVVDHHDVEKGLPGDAEMAAYRGVITYFRSPEMEGAPAYAAWMRHQLESGRKYVVFGEFGALRDRKTGAYLSRAAVDSAFEKLGLSFAGFGTANPALIKLVKADDKGMSFEEPFTGKSAGSFVMIRSIAPGATPYLTLERTDIENGRSQPVIVTRHGGFASGDLLLHEYKQGEAIKQRWHLNPYQFLSDALGLRGEPRLDGASLNGRRLWMAHIDGDGFLSPADPGRLCGQALLEEVLSRFYLPVSVSVISSDLARDERAPLIARRIFDLPQIEAASHSATHPMDWTAREVNPAREVSDSVKTINETVLPPGKRVRLITWSGLCNPPAAALRTAESLGIANINGINGDTGFVNRFDRLYPSRTHLSPMTRAVGGMLQINHRDSNDYDLTGRWSDENRGRFSEIIETFKRTASGPERPANVYFHFYSAHAPEALEALVTVFEWSSREKLSRVFVSDYVKLVEDFRSAQITREADGRYRVRNAGSCRTVVFPDASKHVDMSRSENVVGYAPREGALYVFLDGSSSHLIAIADRPSAAPHLVAAGGWVDHWKAGGTSVSFGFRGFGKTEIAVALPAEGHYRLTSRPRGAAPGRRDFTVVERAKKGVAVFELPATGEDDIVIEPADRSGAMANSIRYPVLAFSLAAFPVWFFVRLRRRLNA